MNLILLSDPDFITPTRVRLTGRRFKHIQDILKAEMRSALNRRKNQWSHGEGDSYEQKTRYHLSLKLNWMPSLRKPYH